MLRIEFEQNLAANEQAGMWWGRVEVGPYLGLLGPGVWPDAHPDARG